MQNFDYQTPTRLIFGKGVVEKLPEVMGQFGKKILLTYGGGSIKKIGLYDKVKELLKDFEIVELSGIQPNPKYDPSVLEGVKLCKENDVELVLVKAPTLYPYWYEEWDDQIKDFADENDLTYINFLDYQDEIGLDWTKDTYDGGLHLNLAGAEKLSEYFGQILANDFKISDRRGVKALDEYWSQVQTRYNAEIQRQTTNLKEYGNVHGPEGK